MNPAPVMLERGDYYELRFSIRDVEAIELDALRAAQDFARQIMVATQKRQETYERMAAKYAFEPNATWGFDDGTCALVQIPERTA